MAKKDRVDITILTMSNFGILYMGTHWVSFFWANDELAASKIARASVKTWVADHNKRHPDRSPGNKEHFQLKHITWRK